MPTMMSRRWVVAIGVLVLCSVAGLSVFLFSSWHKHCRAASSPCGFTAFEHGAYADECGAVLPAEVAAQWVWVRALPGRGKPEQAIVSERPVRAPPEL